MNNYLDKVNDVLSKKTRSTQMLNENTNEISLVEKENKKSKSEKVFQRIFESRK